MSNDIFIHRDDITFSDDFELRDETDGSRWYCHDCKKDQRVKLSCKIIDGRIDDRGVISFSIPLICSICHGNRLGLVVTGVIKTGAEHE